MATLMELKNFMSVPGHPCSTSEIRDLSAEDREELLNLLEESKK